MTAADVLDELFVLDNELDISSGGADESRALKALTMSQKMFALVAAAEPRVLQTHQSVTTTANQEYTAWPTGLARIDAMYLLDTTQTPNRQVYELDVVYETGGQDPTLLWPPFNLLVGSAPGAPKCCYAEMDSKLNWGPFPDAVRTVRLYGLWVPANLTTRNITFGLPDRVSLPVAAFASRLLAMGLDDPSEEVEALAKEAFTPAIRGLRRFTRSKPAPRKYSRVHTT